MGLRGGCCTGQCGACGQWSLVQDWDDLTLTVTQIYGFNTQPVNYYSALVLGSKGFLGSGAALYSGKCVISHHLILSQSSPPRPDSALQWLKQNPPGRTSTQDPSMQGMRHACSSAKQQAGP